MKIYLASRYSRRLELCAYRSDIERRGHEVTSRWLNGEHQLINEGVPVGENGEAMVQGDDSRHGDRNYADDTSARAAVLRDNFAMDDYQDVISAGLVICFTEEPRSDKGRGGRHVEMGIGLGARKKVWVVGPRENIFCWLIGVRHFDNWDQALMRLDLFHHGK